MVTAARVNIEPHPDPDCALQALFSRGRFVTVSVEMVLKEGERARTFLSYARKVTLSSKEPCQAKPCAATRRIIRNNIRSV